MTDAEIICRFMEAKPLELSRLHYSGNRDGIDIEVYRSDGGWWEADAEDRATIHPILETCPNLELLGRLWEVEERLPDKLWPPYRSRIQDQSPTDERWSRILVHATPEQKIVALAAHLRRIVEPETPTATVEP